MKRKYQKIKKYLESKGYYETDVSSYEYGIFRMTYKFQNYNSSLINENYKIHILFTSYDNFSIMLEIVNHPMISPTDDDYGNYDLRVGYTTKYLQLYKGFFPNYLKAKSIIYYTTKRYIEEDKTLLDDNFEFEVKNDTNDLLMRRMTKDRFEYELQKIVDDSLNEKQSYEYDIDIPIVNDSSGYLH